MQSIPREAVPVVIDDNGVEVRLRDEYLRHSPRGPSRRGVPARVISSSRLVLVRSHRDLPVGGLPAGVHRRRGRGRSGRCASG
jgi:hypothetical protein